MTKEIENEMRSTYAASKRKWRIVVILWVVAVALATLTAAPLPRPIAVLANILTFTCAIATYGFRWWAESLYQTAESLRRTILLADGLGEAVDPAELARLRADASEVASADPLPIGRYYTSERERGWFRALHNVQESAFYTGSLARRAGWLCAGAVVVPLLAALLLLFVVSNVPAELDASHVAGSVVMGCVTAIVGGALADVARSYFALARAANVCVDTTRALLALPDVSIRDAIKALDAYDAALAIAPPIPTFIYSRKQARLDRVWRESHAPAIRAGGPA